MTSEYVVAKLEDLPEGGSLIVKVNGREIGVFNVHGHYYALPNVCFHQNGPLCQGSISGTLVANVETNWKNEWVRDGEIIVCPWHSLEYNITTGKSLAYPDRRLPVYKVRAEDGEIKVIL